jgi:hypothetical protein
MAYRRGGYWYRSKRNGGQVETEYLGSGDLGEFVALMDAQEQERRQEEREALAAERAAQAAIDGPLDAAAAQLRGLIGEVLQGAGYHQHKGTWRKRRHGSHRAR